MLLRDTRGGVRLLRLDRPEKRNALSVALCAALLDALQAADADPDIDAVVLAGEGPNFSAGGDMEERRTLTRDEAGWAAREAQADLLLATPGGMGKPVVAALHGRVLGMGASLALCCDMVVAADDLILSWPEARHGVWPRLVAPMLLRHLGPKLAFELLSTGRAMEAGEAARLGLLNRVVPRAALLDEACVLAEAAAGYGPAMLRGLKARIDSAGLRS